MLAKLKALARRFLHGGLARWRRPCALYLLTRRLTPISSAAGVDRGSPVDRYFIERFLHANQDCIRGSCLEVKDNAYTRAYGGARVTRSDILDVNPENTEATIHADLRDLSPIADNTYDCFILTQVLQYVDDLDAAVRQCVRVLKPGGTLLATVPALGKLDGQADKVFGHYWRLTPDSARYLFGKYFAPQDLEIRGWGNVLVGLSFWIGLAREELSQKQLDYIDPEFICGVTIRATKRA